MKITCDSCGSKYTIADAKVAGRKVKVRCKGCNESILVDGTRLSLSGAGDDGDDTDDMAATSDVDNPVPEAPKKDLWSVNLTDDDSRDMTLEELVAGWRDGTVTQDAYVWKDGMGDWKPILEVGELKLKLGSPPKKGVVSSAKSAPKAAKGDDLFGTSALAAGPAAAEPQKPAGSPFDDGDAKLTGARNDSSVLFSLDSLKGAAEAPKQASSSANDLFGDLGAGSVSLTSNADLLMAPAKDPPPAPIGARTQAAPVAPVSGGKGKGMLIGGVIGALVLVGGAVFAFTSGGGDDAAVQEAEAKAAEEAKAALEAKAKLEEELKKVEEEKKRLEEEAKKAAEEKKDDKAEEAKKKEEEEKAKAEAEAKAAEEAKAAASSSSSSSSKPSTSPSPAAESSAAKFDVGAAKAALSAAAANAAACAKPGGPTGTGKVNVTFANSGRVTNAVVVAGPFPGTPVGGCVATTFRKARVPAFSGSPMTVAKSFSIR